MRGTKPEGGIVTFFRFNHLSLFLESVRQIAVCIRKIWLQLNSTTIRINGQIDEPILNNLNDYLFFLKEHQCFTKIILNLS